MRGSVRANDEAFQFSIIRGEAPQVFQNTGRTVRLQGWERHPVVSACVRAVVDIIQAVPIEVYRQTAGGDELVLTRHPALDLLQAPRFAMSPQRLVGLTATHYELYGNAFWVLERVGRRITGIRLVHPEDIQYAYLDDRYQEIVRYEWRDRNAARQVSPVENVVHFADLAGGDWLFGYPRAASAISDILADAEASTYVRQVINNDGGPATLLGVAETVRQEEARAAEERWQERAVERGERGRIRIVPGLGTVHRLGFDLNELEFPDARRIAGERICAVFGVDPRIIGLSSAAKDGGLSGEQFREARFRLIQQAVLPLMKALESQINLWLMPEFGDVYARFSPA
jgi:HK97 family phage portal protein